MTGERSLGRQSTVRLALGETALRGSVRRAPDAATAK